MNRCSDAELLTWLQKALTRENGSWLFYMTCAHIANGPAGDSLREMFLEHAEEEQQHALLIGRKIVALGGYPEPCIDTFNAPETNEAALMLLYFREQEAAELYRCISEACGDDVALRNEIDQIASKEVEHAEELLRLMSPEAAASIRAARGLVSTERPVQASVCRTPPRRTGRR